jgi:alkylhydroperoxidase/carboxymuconolactone decarboxylase family protein YurZ
MSNMTGPPDSAPPKEILRALAESPAGQGIDWSAAVANAPALLDAYRQIGDVAMGDGILDRKVKELALLAVNASTTSLNESEIRRHARLALQAGATKAELSEVLALASVLGVHSLTVGVPILVELVADANGGGIDLPEIDDHRATLKEQFIEARGYWTELWETVLRLSPAYFESYLRYSSVPWTEGTLEPKIKEFIYVAITAATTHLFEPGIRVHMENAIKYGATSEELMELLQVLTLEGGHTLSVGMPIIEDELRNYEYTD